MNCIFYSERLNTKVPCILIPGEIKVIENGIKRDIYVHVYFDESKFTEYGLTHIKLKRYCSEFVNIYEIYPAVTSGQINYANTVIPNGSTNNSDELDKYEAIITMLTSTNNDISREMFYILSDLISYELLFNYCEYNERVFMMSLSMTKLVDQLNVVLVPQMIRMTKRIFNKYSSNTATYYDLDNYNNYYEHDGVLPITLNIDNLKYNVNFIII